MAIGCGPLFAAGHSSGAHLVSLLAVADWEALGGPANLIKGLIAGSGPYMIWSPSTSARNDYLFLDEDTAAVLTPQNHLRAGLLAAVFSGAGVN